ncbi:ABC transporter substrate-binding protein [Archaeoglobus veneficus]|nr:cobalamin-binding protein [Archaeoglobus veneficus]
MKDRVVLIILLSLLIAGCSASQPESTSVTPAQSPASYVNNSATTPPEVNDSKIIRVVDDLGYEVVITKTPQRIVSLAPSNTEILFALGVGDEVVGVTDYCNYPPEAMNRTKVGGYSTIDVEKVIALNPDLVVAAYGNGLETIEALRGHGLTVIALNPKNLSDVMRNIELLGEVTGCEENASQLVEMMKNRIEEVEKAVANTSRPKVAHIMWHDPIWISGNNTFIDELIRLAGGENVFSDMDGWKIVSIEDILERNPDVIIVNSGTGMGGGENALYEWAVSELKDVSAVKNGRVYVIDADIISRPSYRLVYALEEIAGFLHPECFGAESESASKFAYSAVTQG